MTSVAAETATQRSRAAAVRLSRPGSRVAAVALAGYLAAAGLVTMHLWADPANRMIAGNPNDSDSMAWMISYTATAIAHGSPPALVTGALNAPTGISMMWNISLMLPGIVLTPVTLAFGPQASLNVLLTIGFAGSAASMAFVLRRWGVSRPAAILGGAVYGFSPALIHSAIGHYNLQFAVLPPLIINAGLRLCLGRSRPLSGGAVLGLLIAAQYFISSELLMETFLAAVAMVAVLAISRPRAVPGLPVPLAAGVGTAAAATLAVIGWPLWVQFFGPLTEHGSAFLFDFYKNDLTAFIIPSSLMQFHTRASAAAAAAYQGGPTEYLAYLGLPLIIVLALAAVALWRRLPVRVTAMTLAVLVLLSLGAHPLISGTVRNGVTLPWAWLGHLPLIGSMLPDRLSIVADGAAAALLAFALDAVVAKARARGNASMAWLAAVAGVLAVLPLIPRPLPAEQVAALPAGWSAAFGTLRLAAGSRVLVVPVPTATVTEAMRWQAQSGVRIDLNAGFFQGPASDGHTYMEGNGLPPLAYYLDDLWAGTAATQVPTAAQARAALAGWDPAAIVADAVQRPALRRYLTGLLGPPSLVTGDVLAWRMPGKH